MRQDREYILPPGHAVILPEGEDNLLSTDTSLDKIAFGVSGSLAVPLIRSLFGDYFHISGLNCTRIQEYYRRLAPLLRQRNPADIPKISGIGMELLYYLASHLDRSIPAELLRAVEIMNYNSGRLIRVSDIAAECGFSDYQLTRLFLKHYGITPKQYLMRQKLQKCCALLKDSQDRIKEIAASAGYADLHVFSREFRKRYGMTPRQFRNQMRDQPASV